MPKLIQSTRLATLYTPLGDDVLSLRTLHATEQLGRLFTFELEVDSERDDIKADDLLGQPVAVEIECPSGGERFFHGYVNHFTHSPRVGRRYFRYHLTVVPWLWMLTRQADCRIFQKMSVPDILRDVFGRRGFSAFEMNLHGTYEPWEYCVQYRETDFNFISRLLEEEGIYYYFKHTQEEDTLVLVDSPDAHLPFPHYEKVILRARAGTHGEEDELLREWQREHRHHAGAYAQTDYDFTRPRVNLATHDQEPGEFGLPDLEVYDYPGEYTQYPVGEALAKVRMQEIRAERVVYHSSGNVVGIATGHKFSLTGPPGFKDNGDYLVAGTTIHIRSGIYETGGSGDGEGETFVVGCTLTPSADPFRAARLTPKPVIQGVQTAVVTGPAGEEIHTDKYGRIKVQFHWDREGKADENTTCFIRVGQFWAGKKWGAMFIPRIGQEVIVAFLEGDPDQPLVVGSVYNGEQMPFYPLPDHKTKSTIKSNSSKGGQGFNELRFEDKKGGEQVFIHSEKRMDTRVKADVYETNGGNRNVNIGAKDDKHPGGSLSVTVGADANIHINGGLFERVEKKLNQGVVADVVEGYDANQSTIVKAKVELNAKEITFEALTKITLKVGASFIVLDLTGVTIKGPMVKINSGGSATGTGNPEIEDPLDAETADTGEPGYLERPRPPGTGGGRKKRTLNSQHGPEVTRNADGSYQVNRGLKVDGSDPAFASQALADVAVIGTTTQGKALLNDLDTSGKTVTLQKRPPTPSDPLNATAGATDLRAATPAGQPVFDGAGNPFPAPPATQATGTGTGSNSTLEYDPNQWPAPGTSGAPSDVILFHEMTHADHQTHGTQDCSPRTDNFDTNEEFNTIGPENQYRDERGVPRRTDHHDV